MIAETIGGANQRRTAEMYDRYEKSRKHKPTCERCKASLAYDRAADPHPLCHSCEKKLVAQNENPISLDRSERGRKAARTRYSGGDKLPNLRAHRDVAGLTQHALAKLAGIGHHTISNIEVRGGIASPETMKKLCGALGVEADELRGK